MIVALSVLPASTAGLAAQSAPETPQDVATLQHRLDSLAPLLTQAEAAAEEALARRKEAEPQSFVVVTDTLRVGPMHVVTVPDQVDEARELFQEVWDDGYASFIGESRRLGSVPFIFQWPAGEHSIPAAGGVPRIEMRRFRTRAAVENTIRTGISYLLASDLKATNVGRWAPGNVRPPEDPTLVYRRLASAPSVAARACFDGDLDACWSVLAVDLRNDLYPLPEWYSPDERRAMVARAGTVRRDREGWSACIEEGSTSACDAFLLNLHMDMGYLAPVGYPARKALLWIALTRGGSGAWDRIRQDPDMSVGDALRYASGMDTQALAAAWRDWVMERRPDSQAGFDPRLLLALLWVVVFATLAMRSTRWRLG